MNKFRFNLMKEPGNEAAGARAGLNKQMTQAAIWSTPAVVKASAQLINLVTREETQQKCESITTHPRAAGGNNRVGFNVVNW